MSIEKQSLSISPNDGGNKKLVHVYHVISRIHGELREGSPTLLKDATKYDLIAKNTEEALLLFAFRDKKPQRDESNAKKIRKLIKKYIQ